MKLKKKIRGKNSNSLITWNSKKKKWKTHWHYLNDCSRYGRPQRVAPTCFRRDRSPCLPENLIFWATLTHSCTEHGEPPAAGSPLIMVMNKADLRIKHIDEASFQDKFPNIARYHQVSCSLEIQKNKGRFNRAHLDHIDYDTYALLGEIEKVEMGFNKVVAYRARHRCNEGETVLNHILVEM